MAAHRYWRYCVVRPGSVFMYLGVREIEFAASAGGADLTVPGGAVLYSSYSSPTTPAAAVDNSTATQALFQNAAGGDQLAWVGYDFTTPVNIAEIRYTVGTGSSGTGGNWGWAEYSDNGVDWYTGSAAMLHAVSPATSPADFAVITCPVVEPVKRVVGLQGFARRSASPPSVSPVGSREPFVAGSFDRRFGGPGTIEGITAIDDDPDVLVARRVRLYDLQTAELVRETWSAANGAYSFPKLASRRYFLISHDHTEADDAAVRDRVTPE